MIITVRGREKERDSTSCASHALLALAKLDEKENERERELNRENAMYTGSLTTAFVLFAIIYVVVAATKRRATL